MNRYTFQTTLEYTKTPTVTSPINSVMRHGFSYCPLKKTACLMNKNIPKISYEIIRHRRGLLLRIGGRYVPNRRGRPKHFPLPKHIEQYLAKFGGAA